MRGKRDGIVCQRVVRTQDPCREPAARRFRGVFAAFSRRTGSGCVGVVVGGGVGVFTDGGSAAGRFASRCLALASLGPSTEATVVANASRECVIRHIGRENSSRLANASLPSRSPRATSRRRQGVRARACQRAVLTDHGRGATGVVVEGNNATRQAEIRLVRSSRLVQEGEQERGGRRERHRVVHRLW